MMDYTVRDGCTYMYFKDKPLYAFGYGLSYTTFTFDHLRLNKSVLSDGDSIDATVDVTNSGARDGDEVCPALRRPSRLRSSKSLRRTESLPPRSHRSG
jgi:hypothetical protein